MCSSIVYKHTQRSWFTDGLTYWCYKHRTALPKRICSANTSLLERRGFQHLNPIPSLRGHFQLLEQNISSSWRLILHFNSSNSYLIQSPPHRQASPASWGSATFPLSLFPAPTAVVLGQEDREEAQTPACPAVWGQTPASFSWWPLYPTLTGWQSPPWGRVQNRLSAAHIWLLMRGNGHQGSSHRKSYWVYPVPTSISTPRGDWRGPCPSRQLSHAETCKVASHPF